MGKQQREFYRIHYPQVERPLISIEGTSYEVLDLSEAGIRFAIPRSYRPKLGSPVLGTVHFRDSKKLDVKGTVMRLDEAEQICVLKLSVGIPLPKIMEEQRLMLKKYPR